MLPKNRIVFWPSRMPNCCFAADGVRLVFGTALLIPNGMTVTLSPRTPNSSMSSLLHLLGMNQDVVRESILNSKRKAIDARIPEIPPSSIHVVHCEDNSFPQ